MVACYSSPSWDIIFATFLTKQIGLSQFKLKGLDKESAENSAQYYVGHVLKN